MKKLAPEVIKQARKKPKIKIINNWSLVILMLTSLSVLWLVSPTKSILLKLLARSTSPDISLSFLTILRDRDPGNRDIKLLMAQTFYQMGHIREGITLIEPLLDDPSETEDWNTYSLYLDLILAGAYSTERTLKIDSTAKTRSLLNAISAIPDADMARKFADAAISLSMPAQAFHLLEPHIKSDKTDHDELIDLALQTSDYGSALKLLSETLELGGIEGSEIQTSAASLMPVNSDDIDAKRERLIRLHQIYRWQGNTDKAFEISLLIADNNPLEIQLREALDETKALGDIQHEGIFYNKLAKSNQINPAEYGDWLNALEKSQGTEAAVLSVTNLSKKRSHDTELISELSRLYSYRSNHQLVVEQYAKLKTYRKPTFEEANRFSTAYLMLNQPKQALAVLTAPDNWQEADTKYLKNVSSLSWDLSDKALASASQKQLIARSSANLDVYRYIQLNSPFTENDIPGIIELYEQSQNKELLLLAIRTSYESLLRVAVRATYEYGDGDKMNALLALALKNDNIKGNTEVLYYRALLAVHQNKRDAAHRLFRQTLHSDPLYLPAITSYLWWAIEINDQKIIRHLYSTYNLPLSGNQQLWPAFAAAAQQLGDYKQADLWYRKQLSEVEKPNVAVLIHYASLLKMLGQHDQAYRLRLYTARYLSKELLALPDGDISFRSLIALIAGEAAASELATRTMLLNPTPSTVSEFFQYQLALDQTESIKFWHQRTLIASYKLPQWQALAIAIKEDDKSAMEYLLIHSFKLPLADRYYALQATGQHRLAWKEGQELIGTLIDDAEEKQLRSIHVTQHPFMTHSLRSQYYSNYPWDINIFSVEYYAPHNDGYWRLGSYYQTAGTPDVFSGNTIDDELRLRGSSSYQLDNSDFMLEFDIADGLGDKRLGFKATYQAAFSSYWKGAVGVGLNNDIRASQQLATAGSDNLINLFLHYQPSARNSIAFNFNYHEMSTRFGDDIGTGWDGSIRASEQLFFADPAWQLYAEYIMHNADLNDDPLNGINSWNKGTKDLTSADFLDDRYQRIALGQRFWHGSPGKPGSTAPSPRYWLDGSVGYNLETDRADMTVSSGLGWRIIGNDELYLSVDWQSQDRNGDQSSKTSLGYFYSF
ncbi:MAG: putative Zn-dependent protease [Paraglaciecola sp.]|jgi:predicted Zn-dependent protease